MDIDRFEEIMIGALVASVVVVLIIFSICMVRWAFNSDDDRDTRHECECASTSQTTRHGIQHEQEAK